MAENMDLSPFVAPGGCCTSGPILAMLIVAC